MVGRKGRSRGCLTCRQRHIKCDEKQPACIRCARGGFVCDGYPGTQFYNIDHNFELIQSSKRSETDGAVVTSSNTPKLYWSISPHSSNTYITYLKDSLYSNESLPLWPGFLAAQRPDDLAHKCLQALAQAYFGRQHQSIDVERNGSRLYLESLKHIQFQLSYIGNNPCTDSLDLVLSSLILVSYEMLLLSSHNGWISHALGLGTLIEIHGPHAFATEPARSLLESSRFGILLASLAVRKQTFLSKPEWELIPWATNTSTKTSMQYLLDIFADLPGLSESIQIEEMTTTLIPRIVENVKSLMSWRAAWDTNPESLTEPIWDAADFPSNSKLQPRLHYTSLSTANCTCLCDAALIQAIEFLDCLAKRGDTNGNGHFSGHLSELNAIPFTSLSHEAAIEVCRSVRYQLTESKNTMLGQLMVVYPLRMAWKALKGGNTTEGQWIEGTLEQISRSTQKWEVSSQTITFKFSS